MSDSDDDWFNKDLSEFSIDKIPNDIDSQPDTIIVNTQNDNNGSFFYLTIPEKFFDEINFT